MKKIILAITLFSIVLLSCKKKEESSLPSFQQSLAYLTAHTWKVSGSVSNVAVDADGNPNTPPTKDIWNSLSACEKTYTLNFFSDGTGSYSTVGAVCPNPDFQNFRWILASNNTLTLSFTSGTTQILTVVAINDATLKLNIAPRLDDNNVSFIQTDIFSK